MTTSAPAIRVDDATERLSPDLIKLAMVVVLGTFVVQMDGTMVNVALNTLRVQYDSTVSMIQWVSTGYLLALAMAIPPAGWAVDRFGARRTWMAALTCFLVGSVLCGLAWSATSLILFRVLQGIGGGFLLPLSQAILAQAAGPRRVGRLMAVIGVPFLIGPVVGPVIGGILIDEVNWRWIFFINVPICAIGLLLSVQVMPASRPSGAARLDVLGLALLSPALAAIVYGLSQAGNYGSFGDRRAVVPLALGAVLLAAFVWHALRTRVEPVVDLRLLRSRDFTAASSTLFFAITAMLGSMLLVPLYFQTVRGFTALQAGLLLTPQGIGAAIGIGISGRLTGRLSDRSLALAGALLAVAGTAGFTQVVADSSIWLLSGALVLIGAGFGAIVVPATAASYRSLPPAAIPRATSAIRMIQQIGGSIGVAVLAIVLQDNLREAVESLARHGFGRIDVVVAGAFSRTFWVTLIFTGLALVPAVFLRHKPADTELTISERTVHGSP